MSEADEYTCPLLSLSTPARHGRSLRTARACAAASQPVAQSPSTTSVQSRAAPRDAAAHYGAAVQILKSPGVALVAKVSASIDSDPRRCSGTLLGPE
eukprot:scaffold8179_cov430-Prasinococcus_capsulatus_cf.AAC.10